jgi:lipopolysaccharide/colanic/teichoic acid biosynthesis glycosyltransferase
MSTLRGRGSVPGGAAPSWALVNGVDAKRLFDVAAAVVLLVLLAPVMLAAYLAVRATSPGGGFFRQVRLGVGEAPFVLLKFRTMTYRCGEETHRDYVHRMMAGEVLPQDGIYKLDRDPRVTRVGAFLRRTSIDELPQLVNVLRGDMSLVGPRPVLPWEAELFPHWARVRFAVPPGLTGLWQVSGRNRLTMLEGLHLDAEYVDRATPLYDLRILFLTIPALIKGGAR